MPFFTKIIFLEKNCIDSNLGHCVALKKKKKNEKKVVALYQFSLVVCDDGFFSKTWQEKANQIRFAKNEMKKNFNSMFS